MRRFFAHTIAVALVGLIAACSVAPVQEMSDARQAIMAAQQIDIDGRHDEDLTRARNLLRDAGDALREHRFETAKSAAVEAHRTAVEVLREHENEAQADEAEPPPR
jgi:Spy/CpxP family protein refolding chaperone